MVNEQAQRGGDEAETRRLGDVDEDVLWQMDGALLEPSLVGLHAPRIVAKFRELFGDFRALLLIFVASPGPQIFR